MTDTRTNFEPAASRRALNAYLLGSLQIEAFISLQKRLVYEVGGDRSTAAAIVCEHPPCITIGREGSRADIRPNFEALGLSLRPSEGTSTEAARPPVHWVSRGGGTMLHLPGQIACYPILPLDTLNMTVGQYLEELQNLALELLVRFGLRGTLDRERPGVRVNGRRAIHIGVAVRNRIACFGLIVNANPDLDLFHKVNCDGDSLPMTSMQRESSGSPRISGIPHVLMELIEARFGFERASIFHNVHSLLPGSTRYALAPRS